MRIRDYVEKFDTTAEGRDALINRVCNDTVRLCDVIVELFTRRQADLATLGVLQQIWCENAIDVTPFGHPIVRPEFRKFGPLGLLLHTFDQTLSPHKLATFVDALNEVKRLREERRAERRNGDDTK